MDFTHQPERQQITFDMSQVPQGFEKDPPVAFRFGRVAFDNDLETAVAMSHGIDDEGNLDMQMLEAVEQAAEYLADKQGQAFMLLDVARDKETGELVYLSGPVGVVSDSPNPVGLHQGKLTKQPGIDVVDGWADFHGAIGNLSQGGVYFTQYRTTQSGRVPLSDLRRRIGYPGFESSRLEDYNFSQYLLAGEDILDWAALTFEEPNGYYFYMDVALAITEHGADKTTQALNSIHHPEYLELAMTEYKSLNAVNSIISGYDKKREELEVLTEAEKVRANMALREIETTYASIPQRIPSTWDSYPMRVTGPLDNPYGPHIKERHQTANWYLDWLGKLAIAKPETTE